MLAARSRLDSPLRIAVSLLLVSVGLALFVVVPAERSDAAVVRPFARVFSQQTNGSIQITGNTVMTCGTSASCAQAQSGAIAASNNNFVMTYLDVDSDPSTTRSSSANLAIPSGARVLYAGLFWGAARAAGSEGVDATGVPEQIRFRAPGASGYTTLVSDRTDYQSSATADYSSYRNVTSLVRAAGSGTYWGADVAAATGSDRYGAWSLVVAVEDPGAPLRDLTVFNGYATVTNTEVIDTTISGFLAPRSGAVGARFGSVTYEGDNGLTGDYFQVNNTRLADALSPSANFFTSRVSAGGANLTNRNPSSVNTLGIDAKVVDAPGVLPNGATSANLRFATNGDFYYPAALTTQIDLYAPTIQGTKTVSNLSGNTPAKVGDVLQYSMTFSNTGDDAATGSVLTDPLPADVAYVPGSLRVTAGANTGAKTDASGDDQGEYDSGTRTVRVRVGTSATSTAGGRLTRSATTTVTFQARVSTAAAGTTLANTASLGYRADTLGTSYTYNTAEVTTPVAQEADVAITKSASPDPVTAGNQVTYTLTVRNNGPNPAVGVQAVDTLPAGVTYVSSSPSTGSCSVEAQTVTCSLGTLADDAVVTIPVVVRVPAGSDATSLTNVARATSTTSDPALGNNSAAVTTTVVRQADVAITKSATPASPVPGTDVTYTLTATNDGASRAADVTVTDTLPSGMTVRSARSDDATCTVTGSEVSCAVGTLDPGQSVPVTIVAGVPSAAGTATLTNVARVTSSTPDPDPSDNADSASVTPAAPRADLAVDKRVVTSPVVAGRSVQYRVTVTNDGPSDAADVTLEDPLPAGLSAASAAPTSGSCNVDAGTVSCELGRLITGQSAQVTIEARLAPAATGDLVNTATVGSPTADPDPGDNTSTATAAITTSADLAVAKWADPVVDGTQATYTIVVTNNGPSVARAVSVVDPVPPPLTFTSAATTQGSCDPAGSPTTVTCAVGDLAPGASATVTVRAGTPADGSGRGASNTATASSSTPDPVAANDSATYVLPTSSQADVWLTKTVAPNPVVAGETVTYTLTARNDGPSVANGVTVTDTVPGRVTVDSVSTSTPGASCAATSGNAVSCSVATLGSGDTLVVTVRGTVDPGAVGGSLTNTARVSSASPADPTADNDASTATTDVVSRADVEVTKTGPASARAGEEATWTLTATNDGPSVATGVVLTDSLPAGVSYVSSASTPAGVSCTAADGLVTCPVGDLGDGEQVEVTVRGRIDSGVPAGTALTDVGAVSSTTTDVSSDNNSATHTTTVTEQSDVRISKAADPASLVPGGQSTYVLTVTNPGPSDARAVTVTDTLDADLTVLEATFDGGSCSVVARTVTCTRAVLPVAATASARIRVQVAATRQAPVPNTASVSSSTDPGTAGDNSDTLVSGVSPRSDLALVKTASATEIAAGEGVTYTFTVVNNGPSLATGVSLTDLLPADVVPSTATATAGTCTVTSQQVDCDLGGVAVGAPVVVTVTARTAPAAAPGVRTNSARVTSTSPDGVPGNDTSSTDVTLVARADVRLTKTASGDTFVPGRAVAWSIVVNNRGPSTARSTVVTDTLPEGVTDVTAFHGTATPCTVTGRQVTCDLGDRAPGQRIVTIEGQLASAYVPTSLTNTATATAATTDPVPADNQASATSGIARQSDLEIVKTVSDANPVAGQRITYVFSVSNRGPSDALNPQFIDQLPAGLVDVVVNRPTLLGQPATAECELRQPTSPGTADNPNAPTLFCNGPTFRANLPARVVGSIEATIAPGYTGTLTNTARISSDTIDLTAADNESSATSQVTAAADVSVTKTVSPAEPVPGEPVTWTVTARNDGPSTARDVVVRDDVPDEVSDLEVASSVSPEPCTVAAGNDVTCALGDVLPGTEVTTTLTGTLDADFTGQLANTATVSSTTDSTGDDNTDTVSVPTRGEADVSVTKTVAPLRPVPGQAVTYTVLVANAGPSVARSVTLTDPVPAALTDVSVSTGTDPGPCTLTGARVDCALGDLPPGAAPVAVTVRGTVPADYEGDLLNTATIASPTDTTPGNNTSTAGGSTAPQADVSLRKSLAPVTPVPGEDVAYTLDVANAGPSAARATTLRDDLDDAITDLAVSVARGSGTCRVAAGNDVTCDLGTLAPSGAGSTATVTVTGRLPGGYTGRLANRAVVASVNDSTPGNNVDSVVADVAPRADLSLTKAMEPAAPVAGEQVRFTMVVGNAGPSTARQVVVSDTLVAPLRDATASMTDGGTCRVAGQQVDCELASLASGQQATVTVLARVDAAFTGEVTNVGTVSAATPDPDPGNNTARAAGTVTGVVTVGCSTGTTRAAAEADCPELDLDKVARPRVATPGDRITYTVTVSNDGRGAASDVAVVDELHRDLTLVAVTIMAGEAQVTTTSRRVRAVFPVLPPRSDGVVQIVARLDDAADGTVPNVAVATTGTNGVGDVAVQDPALVEVLGSQAETDEESDDQADGQTDESGEQSGTDDGDRPASTDPGGTEEGVLPDTGLTAGVVPLGALSVLLLALGSWLVRRSRVAAPVGRHRA